MTNSKFRSARGRHEGVPVHALDRLTADQDLGHVLKYLTISVLGGIGVGEELDTAAGRIDGGGRNEGEGDEGRVGDEGAALARDAFGIDRAGAVGRLAESGARVAGLS